MDRYHNNEIHSLIISTPDGDFLTRYSQKGLCALEFPSASKPEKRAASRVEIPKQVRRWHGLTTEALARALAGKAPSSLPPLDLSAGTDFQQRVWRVLRQIPPGQTWSYKRVAEAIGAPKALRAVGAACGANPIPVFVPCHRVVAANNRLGGFSSGLHWKRRLLAREGSWPSPGTLQPGAQAELTLH